MPKKSITTHDPQVVLRHQIACAECAGLEAGDDFSHWTRCKGTGRIGNCPDCRGAGFFSFSGDERAGHGYQGRNCCRCGGKGWVGNCAGCRGLSILESADGYAVCPTCRGHGHLYQEFYCEDPIRAALIVRVRDAGRFFVPLGEAPVVFGRLPPPHTTVRLYDEMMTKVHFEIVMDTSNKSHEVHDFGRYALMINGCFLGGTADRVRRHGRSSLDHDPLESDRCPLAFGDVLEIGQYSIEYIALRDQVDQPSATDKAT